MAGMMRVKIQHKIQLVWLEFEKEQGEKYRVDNLRHHVGEIKLDWDDVQE